MAFKIDNQCGAWTFVREQVALTFVLTRPFLEE